MGLARVKSMVEFHGGTVRAHSKGPDQDSEFIIRVPKLVVTSTDANTPGLGSAVAEAEHLLRILIVDNNVDAVGMLEILLYSIRHYVDVVYHLKSALEKLSA